MTQSARAAVRESEAPPPSFEILSPPPGAPVTPLVFASPHSGRVYPRSLMAASQLDCAAIRGSEDAFVDELIASAADAGAVVITARLARAYMDVNREPWELDPRMFEDDLPAYARGRTARVAAGLGSIARIVGEGQEIYRRKLTFAEARRRIDRVHRPYHQAVRALLDDAREKFGLAVLIDLHSMPAAAAGGDPKSGAPDMVLGDRFGAACAPAITRLVERDLEARGYRVARNAPYAGGYTTEFYGRPSKGVHALQIELNRALYLDEQALAPHQGFDRLRTDLSALVGVLAATPWRAFL